MWWKRKLGFEVNIFFKATSNMSSLLFLVTKLNFYSFIVIRFVFLVKYSRGWLWCRYSCNSRIYENVVNKAKKWISKWVLQENKAPQIFRKANTVAGLRPRAQGSGHLAQMFSSEFCEISRNNIFTEYLRATVSVSRWSSFYSWYWNFVEYKISQWHVDGNIFSILFSYFKQIVTRK